MHVADECRALGLRVGDTIFGREEGGRGYWHEARLTLLWLGKEEAMWSVQERSDRRLEWSEPREAGDWMLGCRDWRKVASIIRISRFRTPCSRASASTPNKSVTVSCRTMLIWRWVCCGSRPGSTSSTTWASSSRERPSSSAS